MSTLAEQERFEDAGTLRDRMRSLVRGLARVQRIDPLARSAEIVAARPAAVGGWDVVCVRYGKLAGSTHAPRGTDPMPYVEALRASAEVVAPGVAPAPASLPEETDVILGWLESPGVRIVHLDGEWTCPVGGAVALRADLDGAAVDREAVPAFVAAG
jgi:DNA polymerase-3 subunit epsilon